MELQYNERLGKMRYDMVACINWRFFSMYFAITGAMIIVCYIEDFIVWRLVKSKFNFTDQAELMNSIIENWVSLPILTAKLKAENPKHY